MKKFLSVLLCISFLLASISVLAKDADDVCVYLTRTVSEPTVSEIGGEWTVLALARGGYNVPQGYFDTYYDNVCRYVKQRGGVLHERKYTEYSRVVLALTAVGHDPRNVCGYNLLKPLGDFDKTVYQGVNGAVFALLALDGGEYEMVENAEAATQATRQMYVDFILNAQHENGSFSLGDESVDDTDLTAMAVQALAKYQDDERVKKAVDTAVVFLSQKQDAFGGYGCAESDAQVILALGALNIDLQDVRFLKNGYTVCDDLLQYRAGDGFAHEKSGEMNLMATEQAACALISIQREKQGSVSFYDMNDVVPAVNTAIEGQTDTELLPSVTFPDVTGHMNQQAIEYLAARHIINGISMTEYAPDRTMTRAEFAAVVVRALDLPFVGGNVFADVSLDNWYVGYVNTAYQNGIVAGVSETEFAPLMTITKEEAAVMTARAAKIRGENTEVTDTQMRDILAQFPDYIVSSDWARPSLAYCYQSGILSQDEMEIQPKREVERGEIAQMIYQMLQ